MYGWYTDPWECEETENVELSGGVEDWWGWKWYRHKAEFHRATQYQASLTGVHSVEQPKFASLTKSKVEAEVSPK